MFDIDKLTNAELDRLQDRLTARITQRQAERLAAEREKNDPRPLRAHVGDAGMTFGNELARRNWDQECIAALAAQVVPFAVAPRTSILSRDRKRLGPGEEVRPTEHLDARLGDLTIQMEKLVEDGYVLEKAGAR